MTGRDCFGCCVMIIGLSLEALVNIDLSRLHHCLDVYC